MQRKNSEALTIWGSQGFGVSNLSRETNMKSIAKVKNDFTSFKFDGQEVRVVKKDGEPWFLAADICEVLGLDTTSIRKLDDDEKGLHSMQTPGGVQQVAVVSESGMWTLVLRCRDAVKQGTVPYRVRKWVTGEVLPAIRKTGSYKPEEAKRRQIKSREDLSFTRRDEVGRLLNWFVPMRSNNYHEHVRIGQEFFMEIAELAKHNPKEAYEALCFSGKEMMRFGDAGHSIGFAEMWAKFAMMALINNTKIDTASFADIALAKEPVEGIEHWFNRVH
jgi:prophage antirepressor-like protein